MKMYAMILAALCVASQAAPSDLHYTSMDLAFQKAWALFKGEHDKTYASVDEEYNRQQIFAENLKKIESHNYLYDMGLVSYKMGVNRFTDMESSELKQLSGLKMSGKQSNKISYLPLNNVVLPKAIDWREKGYVTPVKNQGGCGSCWAFSTPVICGFGSAERLRVMTMGKLLANALSPSSKINFGTGANGEVNIKSSDAIAPLPGTFASSIVPTTGSLEGQHFRKTGKLVSLSEQNLVDCSADYGNNGCGGGLMDNAFEYIKANGGIDTEESYPYKAADGNCLYTNKSIGATVAGYVDIESGSEKRLMEAVATIGPVSVGIDAEENFMHYSKGIFEDKSCSPDSLDHGVLVVGFGSENGKDFWIVKNSWGPGWGENGYIRMARNKNNMCGIATKASYPLV